MFMIFDNDHSISRFWGFDNLWSNRQLWELLYTIFPIGLDRAHLQIILVTINPVINLNSL